MADIYNYDSDSLISGTSDSDIISNNANNVTINGGKGDDSIENSGDNVLFKYSSGDGNDLITGFYYNSTLQVMSGSVDKMTSNGTDIFLTIGQGIITLGNAGFPNIIDKKGKAISLPTFEITLNEDVWYGNNSSNVIINGSAGDDGIDNTGSQVSINAGAGNDSIFNQNSSNVTLDGGKGNDTIFNYSTGKNVSIDGGNDDDYIENGGANVTINGGAGNDSINNGYFSETNTNGFAGGSNVTIDGGKGKDVIFNNAANVSINGGAGNDSISNMTSIIWNNETLQDETISANNVTIDGGAGNDSIENHSGDNISINGGAGNDYIINDGGSNVSIEGGAGNDSISGGSFVDGGDGDDYISGGNTIFGGAGNDSIYGGGTINGGAGDDYISDCAIIQYSEGSGNDTIYASSTIQIMSGTIDKIIQNGKNIFIPIGQGSILLEDALNTNLDLTLIDKKGDIISLPSFEITGTNENDYFLNTFSNVTINVGAGDDNIESWGSNVIINTGSGNDYINCMASNVTIDAGADNDKIFNGWGSKISISGGAGDDTIENNGTEITITGGAGNDSIQSWHENVTIDGGADNDYIYNNGASVSISGGKGDDTIFNSEHGDSVTIDGGAGNDSIQSWGSQVSIKGGDGNDTIKNDIDIRWNYETNKYETILGDNVTIDGGAGNDYIESWCSNVTISGGAGNDSILNKGAKVTIEGGTGDDSISNEGSNISISGGTGNDTISNSGSKVLFQYKSGDGNDIIYGFNSTSTLSISGGESDSAYRHGNDIIVAVGDASITLEGVADLDTRLNIKGVNFYPRLIKANETADSINNSLESATIQALGDNDFIDNSGASVSIDGGAGDDSITNSGANVTISGGDGNDLISLGSDVSNNVIVYNEGKDTIEGFNDSSTLKISSGVISSAYTDGTDTFLIVGENTITLKNLSGNKINLMTADDTVSSEYVISILKGTDNADNISNAYSNRTIQAFAGNDSITNSGANVTINGDAGNDSIDNNGYDVIINGGAGADTIQNGGSNVTISGGDGDDTIGNKGDNVTILSGAGDDSISISGANNLINYTSGDGNDIIEGFDETSTLSIAGGEYSSVKSDSDIIVIVGDNLITLKGAATLGTVNIAGTETDIIVKGTEGNDNLNNTFDNAAILAYGGNDTISNTGGNVSIDGGAGNDSIRNEGDNVTILGGAGDDYINNNADAATIDGADGDDTISNFGGGSDSITINGGKGNDSINNSGVGAMISGGEGKDSISNDAESVEIKGGADDDYVNNNSSEAIIDGGTGDDSISNDGRYSTINGDDGNDTINNGESGFNAMISGGTGSDSINNSGSQVTISGGEGDDFITNSGSNFTFQYNAGDGNDFIEGFNETSTLQIGGGSGTYSRDTLENDIIITVGEGKITLSGAATLSALNIVGTSENPLLIEGTDSNNSISNSDSNRIIDAHAGDDYIFNSAFAASINGGAGDDSIYNEYGSNATIKGGTGDDSILNNSGANVVFNYMTGDGNDTIYGFNATSTLNIESNENISAVRGDKDIIVTIGDNTITLVDAAVLDKINVTGVELEEDADAKSGFVWKREGNKVTYSLIVSEENLLELDGVEKSSTLDLEENILKLTADNFSDEGITVISNNGNYEFEIAEGDYSYGKFIASENKDVITNNGRDLSIFGRGGRDSIANNANNVTIDGGAGSDRIANMGANVEVSGGKGNDIISLSGGEQAKNTFVYADGDGKDIIYNFTENDSIKIADNLAVEANIVGDDIEFKVGTGSITIRDGAKSEREVMVIDSTGNDIESLSGNKYTTNGIISNDEDGEPGILLAADFKGTYTANAVSKVNGAQTKKGIAIEGSSAGSLLIGGAGKDTLTSGENIFEMTGGKGNDIFVYNGGKGAIKDYSQRGSNGKDKITLGDSFSVTSYETAADNVILNFGGDNDLTIKGGVGKEITFGSSTVNIYTATGIFDGKEKSVKLSSSLKEFSAAKMNKLISIDGSAADEEIAITGNKKKNYIVAGENGSTLDGGKGKDSLVGGEGADVFIYDSKSGKGNKTIIGYSNDEGDKISLGDASISEVRTKSKDIVLKVGNNKLTLKDIGDNPFTFEENGVTKTFSAGLLVSEDKESVSLTSAADKTIDLSSEAYDEINYKNVSAALLKKAVKITGDVEDNELTGGKGKDSISGGDGDDTICGGKGNDSLWGGSGDDTFIFNAGEGNDLIMDYEQGDLLQIFDKRGREGSFTGTFDDNTLKLSIKGGGKVIFDNVTSSSTFNINGASYHISDQTLTKD